MISWFKLENLVGRVWAFIPSETSSTWIQDLPLPFGPVEYLVTALFIMNFALLIMNFLTDDRKLQKALVSAALTGFALLYLAAAIIILR
jgi:hypothetical protein